MQKFMDRIATIVTVNFLTLIQFKRTARTALELWKKEKLNHRKKLTATMQGQEENYGNNIWIS